MLLTGCVLVSLPCILMKDITLFSPSLLGQDTLCLLCLFLSGLLVDPGLPWSGPFLLNGSGGCVGAFVLLSVWDLAELCCFMADGWEWRRGECREEAESKHDLFPLSICQKHPFSWTQRKIKGRVLAGMKLTPCLIFSRESSMSVLGERGCSVYCSGI